ncbi:MAG: hypothetical protein CMA61_00370, partial [Euryarchaeota archaeon]|nr:hypothetical protein [Euryarchaeota archaeon]
MPRPILDCRQMQTIMEDEKQLLENQKKAFVESNSNDLTAADCEKIFETFDEFLQNGSFFDVEKFLEMDDVLMDKFMHKSMENDVFRNRFNVMCSEYMQFKLDDDSSPRSIKMLYSTNPLKNDVSKEGDLLAAETRHYVSIAPHVPEVCDLLNDPNITVIDEVRMTTIAGSFEKWKNDHEDVVTMTMKYNWDDEATNRYIRWKKMYADEAMKNLKLKIDSPKKGAKIGPYVGGNEKIVVGAPQQLYPIGPKSLSSVNVTNIQILGANGKTFTKTIGTSIDMDEFQKIQDLMDSNEPKKMQLAKLMLTKMSTEYQKLMVDLSMAQNQKLLNMQNQNMMQYSQLRIFKDAMQSAFGDLKNMVKTMNMSVQKLSSQTMYKSFQEKINMLKLDKPDVAANCEDLLYSIPAWQIVPSITQGRIPTRFRTQELGVLILRAVLNGEMNDLPGGNRFDENDLKKLMLICFELDQKMGWYTMDPKMFQMMFEQNSKKSKALLITEKTIMYFGSFIANMMLSGNSGSLDVQIPEKIIEQEKKVKSILNDTNVVTVGEIDYHKFTCKEVDFVQNWQIPDGMMITDDMITKESPWVEKRLKDGLDVDPKNQFISSEDQKKMEDDRQINCPVWVVNEDDSDSSDKKRLIKGVMMASKKVKVSSDSDEMESMESAFSDEFTHTLPGNTMTCKETMDDFSEFLMSKKGRSIVADFHEK